MTASIAPIRSESASRGPEPARRALHIKVRDQILVKMLDADVQVGECCGTEGELAEDFGVSRNTIRKAMAHLESEGYITRRRGVGAIIQKHPLRTPVADTTLRTTGSGRLQVIVQLPAWNDTIEGFYTGHLLKALASPKLDPPMAVQVRHHDDPITLAESRGQAVVVIDPDPATIPHLRSLEQGGVRVVVVEPSQPIDGMVCYFTDRRPIVMEAVQRFYNLGHRAVGLMNHTPNHMGFLQPYIGFLDAHQALGRPIAPGAIVQTTHQAPASYGPDVRNITAWVCSYFGAVGVVAEACQAAGLSIPDDVSILSLDDTGDAPAAGVGKPVSCAISDPAESAQMIHAALHDWREDRRGQLSLLPSQWIERETIAAPLAGTFAS